jgi:peptidyl-dipeptidase Dcp
MERSGRLLARVGNVFYNLNSSHTSDALEAVARDYAPKLANHRTRIMLDADLFRRIDELHGKRDALGLAEDQIRLLERLHLDFVRSGARLGPEAKARMAAIAERLASLHTAFGQNVLHDEKEWRLVLAEPDLAGLPDFVRAAAAEAAKERGLAGQYVITLSRSSVEPFLTF